LVLFQAFRRAVGVFVTAFVFGIMAAMYGLGIVQFLSDERLPPPPESLVENTMIAVPAAILIHIFTTNLKWPAFVVLIRFAASGTVHLVTWWRSDGSKPPQAQSSAFFNHIIFLHLASFAVVMLINLFGSPEPAILAILVGKAAVELLIARYDLAAG
jgi:hypothetical protein